MAHPQSVSETSISRAGNISRDGSKGRNLSKSEIKSAFDAESGSVVPPILSPKLLAEILGLSPKTIYEWIARGRIDGAFRKRGKHVLIWRDRALDIIFNGGEWK